MTLLCFRVFPAAIAILLLKLPLTLAVDSAIDAVPTRAAPEKHHDVPSFSLAELLGRRRRSDLSEALGSTGLLAVTGFSFGGDSGSSLRTSRSDALGGLCRCSSSSSASPSSDGGRRSTSSLLDVDGADSASLGDGSTVRTTVATATVGTTPLPLPVRDIGAACGTPTTGGVMEDLRDYVAEASRAFVSALDGLLEDAASSSSSSFVAGERADGDKGGRRRALMRSVQEDGDERRYASVSSIVGSARHLEHFHVYSKARDRRAGSGAEEEAAALDLHTDAGLFLAFVPALPCSDEEENDYDDSFLVSVPDASNPSEYELRRARFPPDSVAIMLGIGAEQWLDVPRDPYGSAIVPLRATRHAVRMRPGQRRAWYGMMHLVPEYAVVQESPLRTFADMRRSMAASSGNAKRRFGDLDDEGVDDDAAAVGCGLVPSVPLHVGAASSSRSPLQRQRRRLQMVADATACNNVTNFYCWMSCLEIPDAAHARGRINEGQALYCLDPSALATSGNRVSSAVEPCKQGGVVGEAMNEACMGSWQPLAPGVPAQEVKVDGGVSPGSAEEPYCYGGTSMYMRGFQWIGSTCVVYLFPSWVLSSSAKFVGACLGTIAFGASVEGVIHARRRIVGSIPSGCRRLAASSILYGLQLTMGYLVMLVVMTYSGPLFLCVVVGLMIGHASFNYRVLTGDGEDKEGKNGDGSCTVPEGCTPCCQNELGGGRTKMTVGHVSSLKGTLEEAEATAESCCGTAGVTERADDAAELACGEMGKTSETAPACCCSEGDAFLDEIDLEKCKDSTV